MMRRQTMFSATYCDKSEIMAHEGVLSRESSDHWRRECRHGERMWPGMHFPAAPPGLPSRPATAGAAGQDDDDQATAPSSPSSLRPPRRPPAPMAAKTKTHTVVSLWFFVTIPIIFWDALYCFLRPRSMRGGDLHWFWTPYELYQDTDYIYGVPALDAGDGFPNAQSALNVVENLLNMLYLYLAHGVGTPMAPVVGFASATMTLSKTALYWLQEYFCGGCSVGHNSLRDLVLLWMVPNGLWLVVPGYIVWRLGRDICASLCAADRASRKDASGKTQ
ncbi:hypothetical protein B0H21DRAFT_721141 [Amylocystis lapponica]|nr:hypothetical protein B0H21DRAFT_721141 [Amylocystis lapponica]